MFIFSFFETDDFSPVPEGAIVSDAKEDEPEISVEDLHKVILSKLDKCANALTEERVKQFDTQLKNLEIEIENTENKLKKLYSEKEELSKSKDLQDINNIYKQMKESGITIEQLFASVQKPKRAYNKKNTNKENEA